MNYHSHYRHFSEFVCTTWQTYFGDWYYPVTTETLWSLALILSSFTKFEKSAKGNLQAL